MKSITRRLLATAKFSLLILAVAPAVSLAVSRATSEEYNFVTPDNATVTAKILFLCEKGLWRRRERYVRGKVRIVNPIYFPGQTLEVSQNTIRVLGPFGVSTRSFNFRSPINALTIQGSTRVPSTTEVAEIKGTFFTSKTVPLAGGGYITEVYENDYINNFNDGFLTPPIACPR